MTGWIRVESLTRPLRSIELTLARVEWCSVGDGSSQVAKETTDIQLTQIADGALLLSAVALGGGGAPVAAPYQASRGRVSADSKAIERCPRGVRGPPSPVFGESRRPGGARGRDADSHGPAAPLHVPVRQHAHLGRELRADRVRLPGGWPQRGGRVRAAASFAFADAEDGKHPHIEGFWRRWPSRGLRNTTGQRALGALWSGFAAGRVGSGWLLQMACRRRRRRPKNTTPRTVLCG